MSAATLKAWLVSWDLWEAERPAWFVDSTNVLGYDFEEHIVTHAPAEALPRCLLLKVLQGFKKHGKVSSVLYRCYFLEAYPEQTLTMTCHTQGDRA